MADTRKARPHAWIDFDAIRASHDLRDFVVGDLHLTRTGMACCPFHGGGQERTPSLKVYDDHYHCYGCGVHGDVIEWIAARDGLTKVEAARWLAGVPGTSAGPRSQARPRTKTPPSKPVRVEAWADLAWQAEIGGIVERARETLWGPGGVLALDWLRARGLADPTISRFRLGFVAEPFQTDPIACLLDDKGGPRGIDVPRGITLPWLAPGSSYGPSLDTGDVPRWVGMNVRRLSQDFGDIPGKKCQAIAGSTRGYFYPDPILPIEAHPVALIVEGEFDALLGWQELGYLAFVGTVGGAAQEPHRSTLVTLARCPWWLVATDRDAAGVKAAHAWRDRAPHNTLPRNLLHRCSACLAGRARWGAPSRSPEPHHARPRPSPP